MSEAETIGPAAVIVGEVPSYADVQKLYHAKQTARDVYMAYPYFSGDKADVEARVRHTIQKTQLDELWGESIRAFEDACEKFFAEKPPQEEWMCMNCDTEWLADLKSPPSCCSYCHSSDIVSVTEKKAQAEDAGKAQQEL